MAEYEFHEPGFDAWISDAVEGRYTPEPNPLVMTPHQLAAVTGPWRALVDEGIAKGSIIIDRSRPDKH